MKMFDFRCFDRLAVFLESTKPIMDRPIAIKSICYHVAHYCTKSSQLSLYTCICFALLNLHCFVCEIFLQPVSCFSVYIHMCTCNVFAGE